MKNSTTRNSKVPYLFAYDISEPRNARQVLKCLKRWRVDGQLSVHETWITTEQAEDIAAELLEYVDANTDSLILVKLCQRGHGPRIEPNRKRPSAPILGNVTEYKYTQLESGWYIISYDIRDNKRLRYIHKTTISKTSYLQRSVYLYYGTGYRLTELIRDISELMEHREDDVRIYSLTGPNNLWFLCGSIIPVAGMKAQTGQKHNMD